MSAENDAVDLVRRYLDAMERRDLAAASELLAPGFLMTFPGDKRYRTPGQLAAAARGRYRSAIKSYERYDVAPYADGTMIVYCFGTLRGELNDGSTYDGVRFIDRFTVRDGALMDQRVWNDMAETLGERLPRLR